MYKIFNTLFRGALASAEENLADRNALLILDQQIRDCAQALERAKRALALAMAQDNSEKTRLAGIVSRLKDLEIRAGAALDGGRGDLALQAAGAIAELEGDRDAIETACARFAQDTAKLRSITQDNERRLAELERGRRSARVADAVQRLQVSGEFGLASPAGALRDAEATLARLRLRQQENQFAEDYLGEMNRAVSPGAVAGKLEAAGFGPATRPTALSVLDRLKQTRGTAA